MLGKELKDLFDMFLTKRPDETQWFARLRFCPTGVYPINALEFRASHTDPNTAISMAYQDYLQTDDTVRSWPPFLQAIWRRTRTEHKDSVKADIATLKLKNYLGGQVVDFNQLRFLNSSPRQQIILDSIMNRAS